MNIYVIAAAIDKIKKLDIKDPFLKFFIYTYENSIDWGKVKKETAINDINIQIQALIQKLYQKIDPKNPKNNYTKKINPIIEINKTPNLSSDDEHTLQIIDCKKELNESGFEAAKNLRLQQINNAKESRFMEWWNFFTGEENPYKSNPAFSFVVLKMAFDGSKENDKHPTFKVNNKAVTALYNKIGKGTNLTQPHAVSFSSDVAKKTGTIVASAGTPYVNFEIGKEVKISNADKYKNGVYIIESISDGGSGFGSKMVVTPEFKEPTENDPKNKKTETTNDKVILEDNEKTFNVDAAYIKELDQINAAEKEPDPNNPNNGWIIIKSAYHDPVHFEENLQRLSEFSQPNGWCTGAGYGRDYLEKGDFCLYLEGNHAVVAIRFDEDNVGKEIRGQRNMVPYDYYEEILSFLDNHRQYKMIEDDTVNYSQMITSKRANVVFENELQRDPETKKIHGIVQVYNFTQYMQLKKENKELVSSQIIDELIERESLTPIGAWQVAQYYNFDLEKIKNPKIIDKLTEEKKASYDVSHDTNSFFWRWYPWMWCMSVSFKLDRIPNKVIECIAANEITALEFAKWTGYDKKAIPKLIIDKIASETSTSFKYATDSYFYLPGIPEELIASIAKDEQLFGAFAVKSNFDLKNVEEKIMPYILRSPELSALAAKNYDYDKAKIPPAIWQAIVNNIDGCLKFAEGVGYDLKRIDEDILRTIISTSENILLYLERVDFDKSKVPPIIIDLITKDENKCMDYIRFARYDFNKIPKSILVKALENEAYPGFVCHKLSYELSKLDPWNLIIEQLSKKPAACLGFSTLAPNYNKNNLPKIIVNSIANSSPAICYNFLRGRNFNFNEVPKEIIDTIATDTSLVYNIANEKISEWHKQKIYIKKDFKLENELPASFIATISRNPSLAYGVINSVGFSASIPNSLKESIASNPTYSAAFAKGVNYNYAFILPQMIESISGDLQASIEFADGVGSDKNKLRPKMIETIVDGFINNPNKTWAAFKGILEASHYDLSGYDETLRSKIISGIATDTRLCLGLVRSIGPKPNNIPPNVMNVIISNPFLASTYAEIAKYNLKNIPMPIIDSICKSADYSFAFVKAFNFNFDAIPQDILIKIVRDGVSQNPNLLKILKSRYAEYKERAKAVKEMETKPQKMTPQIPTQQKEPIQQDTVQPNIEKEEIKPANSSIKIKEANMLKSKRTNKYSSVKITKIAKDKKMASAETLALCVLTLKIYLKDNENIPEEYANLIENLPSPRQIRQDFSIKECEVLYETVEYLWKAIAKQEIIPEENIQKAPEKMSGNYWMFNNGVLLKGTNHYDIVKKNSALICAMLDIGGMTLQEYLVGNPEKLVWFIIRNGGVRIFISKDGRFYCQMSPEIYGKWGRKKIQKYDFPKKVVKVIDFKVPYENWKSGVSIIL